MYRLSSKYTNFCQKISVCVCSCLHAESPCKMYFILWTMGSDKVLKPLPKSQSGEDPIQSQAFFLPQREKQGWRGVWMGKEKGEEREMANVRASSE